MTFYIEFHTHGYLAVSPGSSRRGGGGDLQAVLDSDQVPYEPDVVRFISNLLEGLTFLHDRNIAHLDIKVENCLNNFI